jgi:hypothetical protein
MRISSTQFQEVSENMSIIRLWHRMRRNYFLMLAESSLDTEYENKWLAKAAYHDEKYYGINV